jgi:hypothetical protein
MIGRSVTFLRLSSFMTSHNQWLSNIRTIPYWTTGVFFLTLTIDDGRTTNHCSHIWLIVLLFNYDSFIISRRPEYRSPSETVPLFFCYPLPRELICCCLANGHIPSKYYLGERLDLKRLGNSSDYILSITQYYFMGTFFSLPVISTLALWTGLCAIWGAARR